MARSLNVKHCLQYCAISSSARSLPFRSMHVIVLDLIVDSSMRYIYKATRRVFLLRDVNPRSLFVIHFDQ